MTSIITTATELSLMMPALAASMALVGILVLLALLVVKEISSALASSRGNRLITAVNIGIAPLLIAFVLIVISKVMLSIK
jgi:hypothetical protein